MSEHSSSSTSGGSSGVPQLEEQFILRLPLELAKKVRRMLHHGNKVEGLSFYIDENQRTGKFMDGNQQYNLTIVDLPCIIESHRTFDGKAFYKSNDIGQMFLVEDPNAPPPGKKDPKYDSSYKLDSGITPPARKIRARKWRKRPAIPREEVRAAEDELSKLVKGDVIDETYELVPAALIDSMTPEALELELSSANPLSQITTPTQEPNGSQLASSQSSQGSQTPQHPPTTPATPQPHPPQQPQSQSQPPAGQTRPYAGKTLIRIPPRPPQ